MDDWILTKIISKEQEAIESMRGKELGHWELSISDKCFGDEPPNQRVKCPKLNSRETIRKNGYKGGDIFPSYAWVEEDCKNCTYFDRVEDSVKKGIIYGEVLICNHPRK